MPTNGRAATIRIQAMRDVGSRLGLNRIRPTTAKTSNVWAESAISEWLRKSSILDEE